MNFNTYPWTFWCTYTVLLADQLLTAKIETLYTGLTAADLLTHSTLVYTSAAILYGNMGSPVQNVWVLLQHEMIKLVMGL